MLNPLHAHAGGCAQQQSCKSVKRHRSKRRPAPRQRTGTRDPTTVHTRRSPHTNTRLAKRKPGAAYLGKALHPLRQARPPEGPTDRRCAGAGPHSAPCPQRPGEACAAGKCHCRCAHPSERDASSKGYHIIHSGRKRDSGTRSRTGMGTERVQACRALLGDSP